MELNRSMRLLQLLGFLLLNLFVISMAKTRTINWVLVEANYTRLCGTRSILTINGMYPGPTLYARRGETLRVNVLNQAQTNVTIHWHGVKQPRNPWSDGPNYITQCPIQAGGNFTYEVNLSDEIGTLWWHAHSDWSRATVHGHLIVTPEKGSTYPFPTPTHEYPLFLGSWFRGGANEVIESALLLGGRVNASDGYTINGQPGDLYPCSRPGTTRFRVRRGRTYLLRIVNGVMNEEMFFAVANHNLTVVGLDGAYVKPISTTYIMTTPGQTMDVLITANQPASRYYMASRAYAGVEYDNTTTTAILEYVGNYTAPTTIPMPSLPDFHDTDAAQNFTNRLKALGTPEHPIDVPKTINKRLIITVSLNTLPCQANNTCQGPRGARLAASLNNISFHAPSLDVLQAYYRNIGGIYETDFPLEPPEVFNYTAARTPANAQVPERATKARVIDFNSTVEIVFQGTNVLSSAENHPLHLHGYSFYVVGYGYGNFNASTDTSGYNLVDPPEMNTVAVPVNGWAAVRFRANNPGVWFMHCHLERHSSWGMETVLIVKNGKHKSQKLRKPPTYLNPC